MNKLLIASVALAFASLSSGAQAVEQAAAPAAHKLPHAAISETLNIPRKAVEVFGSRMTFLEQGRGEPVVFVHGNPTSSYLWRNVIPYVSGSARAIAVDLIGMGASDKPDIAYTFKDHYRYFEGFIEALGLDTVTLVGHDWGAAIAWEYARRNPDKVRRLAFMEAVLPPMFPRSFESMGEFGAVFRAFKDPVKGHKMIVEDNMFVEQILPGLINRPLSNVEMTAYREPFTKQNDRKPILVWPRQLPIEGEPKANVVLMKNIEAFMAKTKMPVLLAYAEPGSIIQPQDIDWFADKIATLQTAFVGQGFHFIQEDQPAAIGRAIEDWMRRN